METNYNKKIAKLNNFNNSETTNVLELQKVRKVANELLELAQVTMMSVRSKEKSVLESTEKYAKELIKNDGDCFIAMSYNSEDNKVIGDLQVDGDAVLVFIYNIDSKEIKMLPHTVYTIGEDGESIDNGLVDISKYNVTEQICLDIAKYFIGCEV